MDSPTNYFSQTKEEEEDSLLDNSENKMSESIGNDRN